MLQNILTTYINIYFALSKTDHISRFQFRLNKTFNARNKIQIVKRVYLRFWIVETIYD